MKRCWTWVCLVAMLCALPVLGLAQSRGNEPLHEVNLDQTGSASFAKDNYFKARWITVSATIDGPASVELKVILEQNDSVVYSRTTHNVEGVYTSPEIYLEYQKSATVPYRVELYVDGALLKEATIHRMLLELNNNTVTTRGIRFREYDPNITDEWMMFTPIDFAEISFNNGTQEIDLIGSNMYIVGKLTVHRDGDRFQFTMQSIDEYNKDLEDHQQSYDRAAREADPDAPIIEDHNIRFSDIKIAMYTSTGAIESVSRADMPAQYQLNQWYSLSDTLRGNTKQILYLNGKVSYDPNGLERIHDTIHGAETEPLLNLLSSFPDGQG